MLKEQISYAKKVARNYVERTNEKDKYNTAFNVGLYAFNTGKYSIKDLENFIKYNEEEEIDIDAMVLVLINTKLDSDEKEAQNQIKNVNKKKSYPDKEAVLDIGFKKCTRNGYSALQYTLDEFDSDEMKIIKKFIEKYVFYVDMITK